MKVKLPVEKEIEITKADFEDYEKVRAGGKTNMFDVRTVEMLSDNLTVEKIKAIIHNFETLMKKYPDVYGKFEKKVREVI